MKSGRGVGYCMNPTCVRYARGRVLPKGADSFVCGKCHWVGKAELERGEMRGRHRVVSEVRVEYAFDPEREIYRSSVVVNEDRLLRPHGVYVLQTPLVESEEMACAVGRAVLARLNAVAFSPTPMPPRPTYDQIRTEGWATLV